MKQMKRDGSYGEYIDAYSETGADGKEQFLKDGKALLTDVGAYLIHHGLDRVEVHANKGGIAVSGEVSAMYWKKDDPTHRVWCEVSTSIVARERKDQACIMARTQEMIAEDRPRPGRVYRYGSTGVNQWLNADLDSLDLADRLLSIFNSRR